MTMPVSVSRNLRIKYILVFLLANSYIADLVAQPGRLLSPDGRYEATLIGSGKSLHYRITETTTGRVNLVTRAQYKTANDVKVGMFSANSQQFAAAYHYGHDGSYSWIGIWSTQTGNLLSTERKPGWIREISWVFRERLSSGSPYTPYPSPVGGVSSPTKSCEGKGTPCRIHPRECSSRGNNWVVNGTIHCINGKSECKAIAGKDYCNRCGGDCGGCYGHSCSQSYLCTPGQLCVNYRPSLNAAQRWQCRPIGEGCTKLQNTCWTKEEVGKAQLGCVEGYR